MTVFLKLGGSLITDKAAEEAPRLDVIHRLAAEIASALDENSGPLVIGHGSGSFGHAVAKRHATRAGAHSAGEWRGFARVSVAAARLNRIVADALHEAGVPVISFAPSASVWCDDGRITRLDARPIQAALAHGLVPLVMGDVAFDSARGGTIVSTEEVFARLAGEITPARVLLAGETEGVYRRWPGAPGDIVAEITPASWADVRAGVGASRGADVTGGMAGKVTDMLALVARHPGLHVQIFSGLIAGAVRRGLHGAALGTRIGAGAGGA